MGGRGEVVQLVGVGVVVVQLTLAGGVFDVRKARGAEGDVGGGGDLGGGGGAREAEETVGARRPKALSPRPTPPSLGEGEDA